MQDPIIKLNNRNSNREKPFSNNLNRKRERYSEVTFTNGKYTDPLINVFKPNDEKKVKDDFILENELSIKKKLIQLAEENKWEKVLLRIEVADLEQISLDNLKSIVLTISELAAEKSEFYYALEYLALWKRKRGVKEDEDIDSWRKTIETACDFNKIDNKEFYTDEMKIISDFIDAATQNKPFEFRQYAREHNISLGNLFRIVLKIQKLLNLISEQDYWKIRKLRDKVNLKGYLYSFAINKLRKTGVIKKISEEVNGIKVKRKFLSNIYKKIKRNNNSNSVIK